MIDEKEICERWNKNSVPQKLLEKNKNNKVFTHTEGPPFLTNKPHYGHIGNGYIKDTIVKHHLYKGEYCHVRAGADTHGLPIEQRIEEEHGLKTKEDIEKYGFKEYNDACRNIVLKYRDFWIKTTNRLGRWMDYENDYKTMDFNFMNSVWWGFSELYKKNLVYEGLKVMPYSVKCATPLSNFETQQNYQDITTESVYVLFKLLNNDIYLLVWTTTPWTLPSNYFLCINKNLEYVLVESEGKKIALQKDTVNILKKGYKILESIDLLNKEYIPLYNYNPHKNYKIIHGDFVKNSGTGIVHIAPTHGEDDYNVCLENNLISKETKLFCILDDYGYVDDNIAQDFLFSNYKEFSSLPLEKRVMYDEFNSLVILSLKNKNSLYSKNKITHSVPFCWRTDTPLIYRTISSWFVRVNREKMIENNKKINWRQSNIGQGRFHNWLMQAEDWCVSRNRYWGCPIPIWKSSDGDILCISSSYELEELTNINLKDLHTHIIDNIVIYKNNKEYRRVKEVFDCWFESGSVPFASMNIVELLRNSEKGLEKENDEWFINSNGEKTYIRPADFIAEGLDQTRGWFYTLLVLSTNLFDTIPFRNVIVNGLVLAEDGKKMAKRLNNFPDPEGIIEEYGSDALRLYFLNSPLSKAEPLRFSENGVKNMKKNVIIPMSNIFSFFGEYLVLFNDELKKCEVTLGINVWILEEYKKLRDSYNKNLDEYNVKSASDDLLKVVDILSNDYLKIGRNLLKGKTNRNEWHESLYVLKVILDSFVLDFRAMLPFFCEMYNENTHLQENNVFNFDNKNYGNFLETYEIIVGIRGVRGKYDINNKKPLKYVGIVNGENVDLECIKQETNILEVCRVNKKINKIIIPIKALFYKTYKNGDLYEKYLSMSNEELLESSIDEKLCNVKYEIDGETSDNIVLQAGKCLIIVNKEYDEKFYYYRMIASGIQKSRKTAGLRVYDKIFVELNGECTKYDLSEGKEYIENILGVSFVKNSDLEKTEFLVEDIYVKFISL